MAVGTESFTKADGAGLGNDLTWSLTDSTAKFGTVGNVGVLNGITPAEVTARAEFDTGSDDMYVQLVIPDFGNTSYADIGLCVRMSSDRKTFYSFKRITLTGGVPAVWELRKYVNDVLTVLVDDDETVAFSFPETARIEVEGDEIRAYIGGVLVASITDTDIPTGTYGGLNGFRNSTSSNRRVLFDNFEVGSLSSGPAPVDEITGSLAIELDLTGTLDAPVASVPTLTGGLDVELDLSGSLDAPTATIPAVSGALDIEIELTGTADAPTPGVPELEGSLNLTIDLAGTLDAPAASVPTLTASLDVELDLAGLLDAPTPATPGLSGRLTVHVGLAGVLDAPTAAVGSLAGSLAVVLALAGAVARPQGEDLIRTWDIPAESRTMSIAAESRQMEVPAP